MDVITPSILSRRYLIAGLAASLTGSSVQAQSNVQTRRFYVPTLWGQLHIYEARPADGGVGTNPALVCFHQTSGSGKLYVRFLPYLATDRVVMAIDTPGYGASDGPSGETSIQDYADTIVRAIEHAGYGPGKLGPVDVLGLLTGSMIAGEITRMRPDLVRRLILAQSPLMSDVDRMSVHDTMIEMLDANWSEKGKNYYVDRLERMLKSVNKEDSAELTMEAYVETVLPGREFMKGELAAMRYPARDLFANITRPTLILSLEQTFKEDVIRGASVIPNAELTEVTGVDRNVFRTNPAAVAPTIRAFLDKP
ncbi:MAG: alpha/beta hydrolase [Proteobacteria bacterium]|nr:alpha/beta hydrolase [Pseudomonadota bacterium]